MTLTETQVLTRFVEWLDRRVISAARGDGVNAMDREPRNKLWLGRLESEESVISSSLGERGERLAPCATGLRVLPIQKTDITFEVVVTCRVWKRQQDKTWTKAPAICETVSVEVRDLGVASHGSHQLSKALEATIGIAGLSCAIQTELEETLDGRRELTILMVNKSPSEHEAVADTTLYECSFEIINLPRTPYLLEGLPDSFRYDRRVEAYGINGGFAVSGASLRTTDTITVDRHRPSYWSHPTAEPDLRFDTLASDPVVSLSALTMALGEWGEAAWSPETLDSRAGAEGWSGEMREEAAQASSDFAQELSRVRRGLALLESNEDLKRAFMHMNKALKHSSRGRYDGWRPFQAGFLLANIACLVDASDAEIVDVVHVPG